VPNEIILQHLHDEPLATHCAVLTNIAADPLALPIQQALIQTNSANLSLKWFHIETLEKDYNRCLTPILIILQAFSENLIDSAGALLSSVIFRR
jgi:hypothetical protein